MAGCLWTTIGWILISLSAAFSFIISGFRGKEPEMLSENMDISVVWLICTVLLLFWLIIDGMDTGLPYWAIIPMILLIVLSVFNFGVLLLGIGWAYYWIKIHEV